MKKILLVIIIICSIIPFVFGSQNLNSRSRHLKIDTVNVSAENIKCRIAKNRRILKQFEDDLKFYKKFMYHFKAYSVKRNVYQQKVNECEKNIKKYQSFIDRDSILIKKINSSSIYCVN